MVRVIKINIITVFCCLFFFSCDKDEAASQAKNDRFIPRIFYDEDNNPFPSDPDSVIILNIDEEFQFSGLQYSPSDRVSISWKVNDAEVSTGKEYTFTASTPGEYNVKLEVSYDGVTNSRSRDIFVLSSGNSSYDPKPYTHVVLSYLTDDASISAIRNLRWEDITHVAYKVATVTSSGTVDYSPGPEMRMTDFLVSKAHEQNVPALLGISGELSGDGWNVYGSTTFGAALNDPAKRASIVESVASYIDHYNMDGIEIRMADIGHDTDPPYTQAIQGVISFLNELRNLLGAEAIITLSVPSPTLNRTTGLYSSWSTRGYTSAALTSILPLVDWLNIRAYSQSGYWGGTNEVGQPSSFELMAEGVRYWKTLVPANKLVMGMPALGIRHLVTIVDDNGIVRSGGWGATNFNFMPYRDILSQMASAYNNDFTEGIAQGVYYNGVPTITQKAQHLKEEGFLGAYLWGGNYDVADDQRSLTEAIAETLK